MINLARTGWCPHSIVGAAHKCLAHSVPSTRRLLAGLRLCLASISPILIWMLAAGTVSAATHTLKDRIDGLARPGERSAPSAAERSIREAMQAFYLKRDYRPLWLENARISSRGDALLKVLTNAAAHGLNPAVYGAQKLTERAGKVDESSMGDLELAMTRAYLDYAGDVSSGVIDNPRRIGGIFRDAKRPPAAKRLDDVASADDLTAFLERLPPDTRRYSSLKSALAKYRQIEQSGGWPTVSKGPTLKGGMRDARVAQVKRRLLVTGELDALGDAELFDDALLVAAKKFQQRHGLGDDGNVGAETIAAMNVSVGERIEQIIINLERRRWLGPYLGDRYIYVNIADNDLKLVEKDKTVHTARAVVGKPFHETPVFSALMTYIEINPYWNVPNSIAVRDLLPKIKANPGFLSANDYLLLARSGDNSSAINPASLDWSKITRQSFPFFLRQKPGANNALGSMAFMFPNPHNVFIHDTASKSLFNVDDRYFSNGCVRVQFPMKLALLLFAGQDGGRWNEGRIKSIIETKQPTRLDLKNPIAVHVTYLTAWADSDGTVQFRKDLYRRDETLKRALLQLAQGK